MGPNVKPGYARESILSYEVETIRLAQSVLHHLVLIVVIGAGLALRGFL